jgi:hypothetical protein
MTYSHPQIQIVTFVISCKIKKIPLYHMILVHHTARTSVAPEESIDGDVLGGPAGREKFDDWFGRDDNGGLWLATGLELEDDHLALPIVLATTSPLV